MAAETDNSKLNYKQGDLLSSGEPYIVHQCNCRSKRALGLAKYIFDKFKYADVYKERQQRTSSSASAGASAFDRPGTLKIRRPPALTQTTLTGQASQPYRPVVVNMFAQDRYGKNAEPAQRREQYFLECLQALEDIKLEEGITSLAFPHGIGCGRAGGNWDHYTRMLEQFARENPDIRVTIYRHE
eukprot:TRINITY_DN12333_c5_g1_i1.p3 TRINITY_DN12333_c5_g1~~TRINITY_DN12333_c5_g1_i1.p3  ORF type:complete len:185 (+),score=19.70 TRINITY_DN12333_c5_g1_i1:2282-2836(+)